MIAAETSGVATKGYATNGPDGKFGPLNFVRRDVGPRRRGVAAVEAGDPEREILRERATELARRALA